LLRFSLLTIVSLLLNRLISKLMHDGHMQDTVSFILFLTAYRMGSITG